MLEQQLADFHVRTVWQQRSQMTWIIIKKKSQSRQRFLVGQLWGCMLFVGGWELAWVEWTPHQSCWRPLELWWLAGRVVLLFWQGGHPSPPPVNRQYFNEHKITKMYSNFYIRLPLLSIQCIMETLFHWLNNHCILAEIFVMLLVITFANRTAVEQVCLGTLHVRWNVSQICWIYFTDLIQFRLEISAV